MSQSISAAVSWSQSISWCRHRRTDRRHQTEAQVQPNAPKGVNGRNSDNTKIKEYLGWEPSIRLKEGLAKTYEWIESEMMAFSRSKSRYI